MNRYPLLAKGTFERFMAIVYSPMYRQCTGDGERLAASRVVADIRLCERRRMSDVVRQNNRHIFTFSRVSSHMLLKRRALREELLTYFTLEWTVSRMGLQRGVQTK